VLSDLENEGYEVQPFIIPACAVNAPHRRDRVWIVAHAKRLRRSEIQSQINVEKFNVQNENESSVLLGSSNFSEFRDERRIYESGIRISNDGLSKELVKHNGLSLKAAGNAIVPQVALQIFKAIQQYDNINL